MSLPVIVLAGERPGGNPLARALGKSAGILVDVAGKSCVSRVLEALAGSQSIAAGVMIGPEPSVANSEEMRQLFAVHDFSWLEPATGPAESALIALNSLSHRPVLITSADHALLTPAIIDTFCHLALASDADFVVGLVPYSLVHQAFPQSKRTLLRFADGTFCGSNLFMVRTQAGVGVVKFWQTMKSHSKRPWRMATELGIFTLLRYLLGRLPLRAALDRVGHLAGAQIGHVELLEARAAVDVDSLADHALAEKVIGSC
jgi:GTP:adenosylcobinamide-phosphate guanylyltransferase